MEIVALLLTAALFGGMVLYSFGFAPFIFTQFDAVQAGKTIRAAFPWYYTFVLIGSAVAAFALIFVNVLTAQLLLVCTVIGIIAQFFLMPAINNARDNGQEEKFKQLHFLSVFLNFVQLGLIVWALIRFL